MPSPSARRVDTKTPKLSSFKSNHLLTRHHQTETHISGFPAFAAGIDHSAPNERVHWKAVAHRTRKFSLVHCEIALAIYVEEVASVITTFVVITIVAIVVVVDENLRYARCR